MAFSKAAIKQALELEGFDSGAAQQKMVPQPRGIRLPDVQKSTRQGGVLVLLYKKNELTHLVLTKRRADLNSHAGQISFPGGKREVGESLEMTALREAEEELNVKPETLESLGRLACLYIPPSDYEVYPFVAWHDGPPHFTPAIDEVAEIIEVPLTLLLDRSNYREEMWEIRGFQVHVPFFQVFEHQVWGATAMMLSELVERLRLQGGDSG